MLNRRNLITGLISFAVTAPAIVRAGSLMPVKVMKPNTYHLINKITEEYIDFWVIDKENVFYRLYFDNILKRESLTIEFFKDDQWQ